MVDADLAMARLRLATEQSEALQHGLHQRQDDLLSLEQCAKSMLSGRSTGRVVVDQAEDIRRSINIYMSEQLEDIRTALTLAGRAIADSTIDGCRPREQAHLFAHMVDVAADETRQATMSLQDVCHALTSTAQAAADGPGLSKVAQVGVEQAANRLESARRTVFRVVEHLPVITRAFEEMPQTDQTGSGIDVSERSAAAAQRSFGAVVAHRQPPPMGTAEAVGISLDR